jgi:hypothetical protein
MMAIAARHDERDQRIAALQAEVEQLKRALEMSAPGPDASDQALLGRGLRGGFFGGFEVVIGTFALLVLLSVVHQLTATP